jgi:hypothetical protein
MWSLKQSTPLKLINIKFCDLHTPLFMAGTNMGTKLDITKRAGLMMAYSYENQELIVWFNNQISTIPASNLVSKMPVNISDLGYEKPTIRVELQKPDTAPDPNPRIQAQVSTPQSHVFHEGPGLTGLGEKLK